MRQYSETLKIDGHVYHFDENGDAHNEHGPAIEWADGRKSYWLNGVFYDYKVWKKEVEKLKEPKVKELTLGKVSKLLGYEVKIVKE